MTKLFTVLKVDDQLYRIDWTWSQAVCTLRETSQVRQPIPCPRLIFRPSVMELGGKSPALVLPGADVKIAANNVCPSWLPVLISDYLRCFLEFWPDLYVDRTSYRS